MINNLSMKLVLSPAKSLDFKSDLPTTKITESCFLKESERLNKLLKKKSARSLSKLMSISPSLGQLNYERNQEWELPFTKENARQAMYAFSGDVYRGLNAYTIPKNKLDKVQDMSNGLVDSSAKFKWGAKKLSFQALVNMYAPVVAMGVFVLFVSSS